MQVPVEKLQLREYWAALRRRRWVIYLSVATAGLIALVGSFLLTPLYRATATLHIERHTPDILSFKDLARVDYSWSGHEAFYETQYKILSSDAVARRAVRRLNLPDHPLVEERASKPGLLARIRALVPGGKAAAKSPEDLATAWIQGNLEVSPLIHSNLVRISWVSPDAELATRVCNAVADAYIYHTLESKYSTTDQASEFLVNQIGALKDEIGEIDEKLRAYAESKQIISVDGSSNITLGALSDIARRRTEARTRLAEKEAAYAAVQDSPPEALPEVLRSPVVANLTEIASGVEAEHSEKLERFKSDWPGMKTLESKLRQSRERLDLEIAAIARRVVAAAEADYRKTLNEVRNLEALLDEQEEAAHKVQRDAREYATLHSELQRKRDTLNSLLTRQNEMAVSKRLKDLDVTSSNIRVLDRARTPVAPFRPNKTRNVVLGLLLGLLLGVTMAFVLDHLDNTIASASELKTFVDLPVLAVIPRSDGSGISQHTLDLIAHRDRRAHASEAFRELRTSILLSNPGRPPRQLLITSTQPDEGKSTTCANLAVVLSQLGRRVLIVDTDLHRPRLHKMFEQGDRAGVSSYLSGLQDDPMQLVLPTPIENLDLLPSGPIPPNPSELLNSRVFARMGVRLLEAGYDHLVYDSPPVLSVSDPVIIASVVDSAILVVGAHRTARDSVRAAVEKLSQAGASSVGTVLNGVDTRSHPYLSRYRYYYGRPSTSGDVPGQDLEEEASREAGGSAARAGRLRGV